MKAGAITLLADGEAIALSEMLLERSDEPPQGASLGHNGETSKHQEGITDAKRQRLFTRPPQRLN